MNLTGKNDKIYISCTGPYVLYMYVCYVRMDDHESIGKLQLRVMGQKTLASSHTLNATSQKVCEGLHSTVYLRAKEQASLHLTVTGSFKVKKAVVALSSLLGDKCDFWWSLAKTLKGHKGWKFQRCLPVAVTTGRQSGGSFWFNGQQGILLKKSHD